MAQLDLLFQVPETSRVILESFHSVRLHFHHLLIHLFRFLVLAHLEVTLGHLTQYPAGRVLSLRENCKELYAFLAFVETQKLVRLTQNTQQSH
jgi:hypothetical protein